MVGKPLYGQEVRHFDYLYPTSKARESQVIRTVHSIRGEALIIGRRLFQCGYSKVQRLLEGGVYLRHCSY